MSDRRFWMAEPGNTPEGPYDIETLRDLRVQGRIGANTQLCLDGGTAWQPAASVLGGVPLGAHPPAVHSGGGSWAAGLADAPGATATRADQPTGGGLGGQYGSQAAGFHTGALSGTSPVSIVGPIIATMVGAAFGPCLLGVAAGIASIIYATQANEARVLGDIAGLERKASLSRTWMIVAFVLSGLGCILTCAMSILFITMGGMGP